MPGGAVAVAGAHGVIGASVVRGLRQAGFAVTEVGEHGIGQDADALVHLRVGPEPDHGRLTELLVVASDAGVGHLTLLSSASVYGAWPNNPLPLTEDAPVAPNPATPFAVRHAEAERLVAEAQARPGQTALRVAVLRPAPVVSSPIGGPLGETMLAVAPIRTKRDDPPAQFLHVDDLVSAVVLAVANRLDGVFNVAPDGWLEPDELRKLLGARPKVRLPWALPNWLDRYVARRIGHAALSGFLPYTRYPWVVSNERLRAHGWRPKFGNDQAFVEADEGMPWDDLNAFQRQMVSLVVSGALLLGGLVTAAWLVPRLVRRRGRSLRRTPGSL